MIEYLHFLPIKKMACILVKNINALDVILIPFLIRINLEELWKCNTKNPLNIFDIKFIAIH